MGYFLNAIGWISFHFTKRVIILATCLFFWVGSMVVVSANTALMTGIASLSSKVGVTAVTTTLEAANSVSKKAAKRLGKKVNRRTKRILAVNTIGAAGSWIPYLGFAVASAAAAYEAIMICDNSNDIREMQRAMGVTPDPAAIGDTCEKAQKFWDNTPSLVRDYITRMVDAWAPDAVYEEDPIQVWVDGEKVDINSRTNPDWLLSVQ